MPQKLILQNVNYFKDRGIVIKDSKFTEEKKSNVKIVPKTLLELEKTNTNNIDGCCFVQRGISNSLNIIHSKYVRKTSSK